MGHPVSTYPVGLFLIFAFMPGFFIYTDIGNCAAGLKLIVVDL